MNIPSGIRQLGCATAKQEQEGFNMPSLPVIQQLRRYAISRKVAFRALEPDLIMEDAAQVGRLPRGRSGWAG